MTKDERGGVFVHSCGVVLAAVRASSFVIFSSFVLLASSFPSAAVAAEPTQDQLAFFENKVRPIFAGNCYSCHSLEQGKSKGGLTLDTRAGWLKGGERGAVIVPGDPAKSLLVTAVGYGDPDLQMPPKGKKLADEQIAALTEWVKMGAPDPRTGGNGKTDAKLTGLTDKARAHWAYQPVAKPEVPRVKNAAWCATPVDNFILAKLEAHGMVPAPAAEKETLIRRAYYDLIGLPPTPQEVQAFVADGSPQAFATVVDRLLASPHYGERWGRHWLDTARYSDTIGGERNAQRGTDYRYPYAWTYRDYVIDAFNRDKPYDQFVVEQIAADKLPATQQEKTSLAALGFLTVGERFRNPNDVINDRIDVVAKGFLGATVTCARCHDHMFDPIPTRDYYALHGVFASTVEPAEKPMIKPPNLAEHLDFQRKLAALEQQNRESYYRFASGINAEFRQKIGGYLGLFKDRPGRLSAEEIQARNQLIKDAGLEQELAQILVRQQRQRGGAEIFGPLRMFAGIDEADFPGRAAEIAARIAANDDRRRKFNPVVAAAFAEAQPAAMGEVIDLYARVFAEAEKQRDAFLKSRREPVPPATTAAVSTAAAPASSPHGGNHIPVASAAIAASTAPVIDAGVAQLLQFPFEIPPVAELTTARIRQLLENLPPRVLNRFARQSPFTFAKINELELTHRGAPARAMVVADADRPRNSPVFIRGQQQVRGEVVPRRFLEILSPDGKPEPFREGSGRLELALAIARTSNPLTARVMVNRVWMHHFGEGFVRTPDDLGTQSEPPSHPELLDYLSSCFMENGWSLKKLHRFIMLSKVYQESTRTRPEYEKRDPENRLLWRANIRRLDFEALRDSLLVFSGKLDRTLGGQPVNLTDEPYSYRRSVYGYIDRGNLPELMAHFDFSDPDMPNSKRNSTVVPQQALFLMNSPMVVDVARHIAARPELAAARNDAEKIIALYRVVFQRTPKPAEIQLGLRFLAIETEQWAANAAPDGSPEQLQQQQQQRKANEARRRRLQQNGGGGRNEAMRPIRNEGEPVERKPLTPWETLAQTLLLSNEASYVN